MKRSLVKILCFFTLMFFILGSIGGICVTISSGYYVITIGVIVCVILGIPKLSEIVNMMINGKL